MARLILPYQRVEDLNGHPLPGAKMYFYESETVMPKDTYSDEALTTPNANPVIADSQGQFGDIFLSGAYSVKLDDADDVTQPDYPAEIAATVDTAASVLLTTDQTVGGIKTFTDRTAHKADTPIIELEENDAPANNRLWQFAVTAEQFVMRVANDARDTFGSIFTVDRTGTTVDAVDVVSTDIKHNGVNMYAAIDEDDMVSDSNVLVPTQQSVKAYIDNRTISLLYKIIDIGDWNMDATTSVSIAHGLTYADIRIVSVQIREDLDTSIYNIITGDSLTGEVAGLASVGSTNVGLFRRAGGQFDGVDFDATSFNRGWITIGYIE